MSDVHQDHANVVDRAGFATTLFLAGLTGASGVAFGALGAHYLGPYLESQGIAAELISKRLSQFDTGARYHLVHSVALLGLAAFQKNPCPTLRSSGLLSTAAILWVAGIILFSGSLYLLVLSGKTWLGAITPLGGLSWIVAWTLVAVCGWKNRHRLSEPTSSPS